MFTGIVEELGVFRSLESSENAMKVRIGCSEVLKGMKRGDSIAVNGICLTACSFDSGSFTADVMPETLRRSNLGKLRKDGHVNLERAMKASDRFGGHIVSGHIDGTAMISDKKTDQNALLVSLRAEPALLRYIVQKGSVAIDGISLTVTFVNNEAFGVSLIPLTAKLTTLGFKGSGDLVNIECDIVGKYIEKFISERRHSAESRITEDFLREHGFA